MPKLGIIAGGGSLPRQIIDACRRTERAFYVLAIQGSADPDIVDEGPAEWIRMSALSRALEAARREGVDELVLVGRIPRPSIAELMRDLRSAKFMAKVGTRMLGDDNILSALVKELEQAEGFRVVAPESLLDDILAEPGTYGSIEPGAEDRADIERGIAVGHEVGRLDIGQAVIVQHGTVLGVEGVEGTDRLIARCAEFVRSDVPGGVLVKVAKPGQERRADLPTVGRDTVLNAAAAGLRGIAVEAGGALIVDRAGMISAADSAGLFVVGVAADDRPAE